LAGANLIRFEPVTRDQAVALLTLSIVKGITTTEIELEAINKALNSPTAAIDNTFEANQKLLADLDRFTSIFPKYR